MSRVLRLLVPVAVIVVSAFIALLWFLDSNNAKRNRYLIPAGYKGWLCVSYAVPGAAPLPKEDGFNLVMFDSDGIVQTSDPGAPGKLKDEFWWHANGERKRLDEGAELGGGFTTAHIQTPECYTFMFWVSKNPRAEQPPYNPEKPARCGPS